MVQMAVADKDMIHRAPADGLQQRAQMRGDRGAGVNHDNPVTAQQIGIGPPVPSSPTGWVPAPAPDQRAKPEPSPAVARILRWSVSSGLSSGTNARYRRAMTFRWIKNAMPRGIYARAALILVFPVLFLQLLVSVVFIQRHF